MTMTKGVSTIIKDKEGNYSLKKIVVILFVLMVLTSWIADQFFGIRSPEYMFSLIIDLLKQVITEIS